MSESLRERVARVLYEVATAGFPEVPSFDDAHEFDKADCYVAAQALIAAGLVTDRAALIQESAAMGFDTAIKSLTYSDGTPVDVVRVANPYRVHP